MKVLVLICLVSATILLGGAAINKQYFNCDQRFPCIEYHSPDKPG